ncbi:MAG: DUF302 domain-containing protein [Vicingaceae bacterium]
MEYCFTRNFDNTTFEKLVAGTKKALELEGFGVLTEIDLQQAFKEKLKVNFKKYQILGACNPRFAHQALKAEEHIGVFLPCNIVIAESDKQDSFTVSVVNPIASMMAVENEALVSIADEISSKLKWVLKSI